MGGASRACTFWRRRGGHRHRRRAAKMGVRSGWGRRRRKGGFCRGEDRGGNQMARRLSARDDCRRCGARVQRLDGLQGARRPRQKIRLRTESASWSRWMYVARKPNHATTKLEMVLGKHRGLQSHMCLLPLPQPFPTTWSWKFLEAIAQPQEPSWGLRLLVAVVGVSLTISGANSWYQD